MDLFDYRALLGTPSPELAALGASHEPGPAQHTGGCSSLGGFNPLDDADAAWCAAAVCCCVARWACLLPRLPCRPSWPPPLLTLLPVCLSLRLPRPSSKCRAADSQGVVARLDGPAAGSGAAAAVPDASPDGLSGLDLHALASADLPEHPASMAQQHGFEATPEPEQYGTPLEQPSRLEQLTPGGALPAC